MRSVVVTGVSTGIGWATTKVLIKGGFHVFGSVRKAADAERLKGEFGAAFTPLMFDVTDEAAINAAAGEVRAALKGETLAGLVNNAGVAVAGPLLYLKPEDFRWQMEVNLTSLLLVTQAFAPLLGTDPDVKGPKGRLVNIGSTGGRNANPFMGPYCASKFALEGFSESLRRELLGFGVDVIVVAPGAIVTPIWDKAEELDLTPYLNTPYAKALGGFRDYMVANGAKGLPAEAVGETVLNALTSTAPKVRYEVRRRNLQSLIQGLLPKRTVDAAMGKALGLTAG
ncbi:MAG: SDR family oxidoreductase [Caulobacteraceae bacterium]